MKFIFLLISFSTLFFGKINFGNQTFQEEIYLRDFYTTLKESNTQLKWTVVLNKGTNYRFRLFEHSGSASLMSKKIPEHDIFLQLSHNKDTLEIANNQNQFTFDFKCPKSAMYYVNIGYTDSCAIEKIYALGILYFLSKSK